MAINAPTERVIVIGTSMHDNFPDWKITVTPTRDSRFIASCPLLVGFTTVGNSEDEAILLLSAMLQDSLNAQPDAPAQRFNLPFPVVRRGGLH